MTQIIFHFMTINPWKRNCSSFFAYWRLSFHEKNCEFIFCSKKYVETELFFNFCICDWSMIWPSWVADALMIAIHIQYQNVGIPNLMSSGSKDCHPDSCFLQLPAFGKVFVKIWFLETIMTTPNRIVKNWNIAYLVFKKPNSWVTEMCGCQG